MGAASDTTVISKNVDRVMYVAGTNETYLSHTQIGGEKLKKADANVLGGVLNKYEVTQPNYAY